MNAKLKELDFFGEDVFEIFSLSSNGFFRITTLPPNNWGTSFTTANFVPDKKTPQYYNTTLAFDKIFIKKASNESIIMIAEGSAPNLKEVLEIKINKPELGQTKLEFKAKITAKQDLHNDSVIVVPLRISSMYYLPNAHDISRLEYETDEGNKTIKISPPSEIDYLSSLKDNSTIVAYQERRLSDITGHDFKVYDGKLYDYRPTHYIKLIDPPAEEWKMLLMQFTTETEFSDNIVVMFYWDGFDVWKKGETRVFEYEVKASQVYPYQ